MALYVHLSGVARSDANLMPPIIEAVRAYVTLGQISDAMHRVFGEYHPRMKFR